MQKVFPAPKPLSVAVPENRGGRIRADPCAFRPLPLAHLRCFRRWRRSAHSLFSKTPTKGWEFFESGFILCPGWGFIFLALQTRFCRPNKRSRACCPAAPAVKFAFGEFHDTRKRAKKTSSLFFFYARVSRAGAAPKVFILILFYSKFNFPTEVTVEGRAGTSSSARFWKAWSPMVSNPSSRVRTVTEEQFRKAPLPMVLI